MTRLLRLLRTLPLWLALASWLTGATATLILPGCSFMGGSAQGCRFLGQNMSDTVSSLASAAPYLLGLSVLWFAVMSLVIALIQSRRT